MSKITKIVAVAAVLGIIGVTALPIASYAAVVTENVTVTLSVTDGLTIGGADGDPNTALMNYNHEYGPASNAADSTGTASMANHGTITILSNVAAGYTLTLASSTTATGLECSTATTCNTASIPTQAGLPAAGTPGWSAAYSAKLATAAGTGDLTSAGGGSGWVAMPASNGTALQVASTSAISAAMGDQYDYAFATAISAATLAGTYTNTVTFTATSK
ncbi:hypothetical protein FWD20_00805 [Candidatus Saccharibacteria bacterium]|nr:hypothetical protein [Candidatus Saccharibacteria bacterium]